MDQTHGQFAFFFFACFLLLTGLLMGEISLKSSSIWRPESQGELVSLLLFLGCLLRLWLLWFFLILLDYHLSIAVSAGLHDINEVCYMR